MNIEIHPNAKALIFDIDGTLADNMPVHYDCWVEVLKNNGIQCNRDIIKQLAGIPTAKIVPEINKMFNSNLDVETIVRQIEKAYIKNIKRVKPIKPIIDIVKEYYRKLPVSAGTGSYRHIAELTLKTINMYSYFDILVTADNVKHHKPNPDTFLKCAELMKVNPEHCQVFEDAENGFEAVKNAGMILTDINKYL